MRYYYQLYPELVDIDNAGNEYTFLCLRCYKAYKNDICYILSISTSVDFGNYHRINNLIEPNLHKQIILSLNWLYSVNIKVMTNRKGFIQTHGMNRIRGNKILFHHNCIIKINQ